MPTQLDCSIGIKVESAYGTPVTVDQHLEFTSESLGATLEYAQSEAMRAGYRVRRARGRVLGKVMAGGNIGLEVGTKGFGTILRAALGDVTSTLVESGVYQQVHTPEAADFPPSFTLQKGVPLLGGAVQALTYPGAMCNSIEFTATEGQVVTAETEWTAKEELDDVALATLTYPAALDLFSFVHGALVLGGTLTKPSTTALASSTASASANVRDVKVKWSQGLDSDGHNIGGAGKRSRAQAAGWGEISGTMTVEFDAVTLYEAWRDNTPMALLLTFTHPTLIGATAYPVLQVVVPAIYLDGETPKANGGGVITQSVGFTGLDPLVSDQAPLYVVYRTTDTTV